MGDEKRKHTHPVAVARDAAGGGEGHAAAEGTQVGDLLLVPREGSGGGGTSGRALAVLSLPYLHRGGLEELALASGQVEGAVASFHVEEVHDVPVLFGVVVGVVVGERYQGRSGGGGDGRGRRGGGGGGGCGGGGRLGHGGRLWKEGRQRVSEEEGGVMNEERGADLRWRTALRSCVSSRGGGEAGGLRHGLVGVWLLICWMRRGSEERSY